MYVCTCNGCCVLVNGCMLENGQAGRWVQGYGDMQCFMNGCFNKLLDECMFYGLNASMTCLKNA